jgi:glycosyltransferase involved in cell wall biosynthesis
MAAFSSMTTPLVSVLLPVYNAQDYLKQSIDSILGQTLTDFELIIVNDGSTDGSKAIIDSYSDPRIIVIDQANAGLPVSLNRAISRAKGKYLARQDADDVSEPIRFEKQIELMEEARLDFCGCNFLMINERGDLLQSVVMPSSMDAITVAMACTVPFAHGSVMMRHGFLKDHDLKYDPSCAIEDYDLWCRAYQLGAQFGNVGEFLFSYRHFDQSLSKLRAGSMRQKTKILRRHFVRENLVAVQGAVENLIASKAILNPREANFLVLAAYLVGMNTHSKLVFRAMKRAGAKASAIALAKVLMGF